MREGRQKGSEANVGRPAVTGRAGVRRRPRADARRQRLVGAVRLRVPPALRRPGVARRSRRALLARPARAARPVRAGLDRQRRPAERRAGASRRRQPEHRARRCAASTREGGYRVISGARFGDVGAFVRYENFDTQFRMPAGYVPLPEFDRDAWVVGATYWPDPDIAVKVDYSIVAQPELGRSQAPNSFNVGLGWWF